MTFSDSFNNSIWISNSFQSPSKTTPPWTQESLLHFWGTRRQNALRRVISIVSGTLEFILLDSWTISLTRSGLKDFNRFTNGTSLVWGSLEFWTLDTIILWVDLFTLRVNSLRSFTFGLLRNPHDPLYYSCSFIDEP